MGRQAGRIVLQAVYRVARVVVVLLVVLFLVRVRLLNHLLYFPMRPTGETPAQAGLAFEDVTFRTSDGETLHGWWIPATKQPATAHVIFAHGNAGTVADRIDPASLLAERGFDVFLFDYRGYGRSTGSPDEEGTYQDARGARDAVLARGVDAKRLIYVGESLGGAVALELAVAHPPAALALLYSFTSVRELARLHYPMIPPPIVPNAYPSLERIRGLRTPVFITHGGRDDIIPIEHGRRLFEAAPEPKRFLEIPLAGHNDLFLVAGTHWARDFTAWAGEVLRR
ncbi:MAG TPA: alpha/beta hydrolase [Vicinamibacteria bacterium]|nr:alpha/beta hydrolase [Vicinamibacteria bacterium]